LTQHTRTITIVILIYLYFLPLR